MSELTVGDLGTLFDGPHATPTRIEDGPYFLNISSLNQGRLDLTQSDHVSEADFGTWTKRVEPAEGDLLFSYETRLGEAALMPAGIRACLGRRMALIRPDRAAVDPKFFLYYFLSPSFQRTIDQHTIHGATVNRISLSTMGSWPVRIPALTEQRAIAEVLGALDDKIAANTKLAATAEALGRALFQNSTAASEATTVILGHVAKNVAGKYLSKDDYASDGPYFIYGSNSIMGRHDRALCQGGFAVLAKIGSYCGNLRWSQRPAWVNNNASAIVPSDGTEPSILRHALDRVDMAPHKAGTGQPYIRMESLFSAELTVPSPEAAAAIAPALQNLSEIEERSREENTTLSAMRNALLPQLMSGKLRVKDAEKVLEDARV